MVRLSRAGGARTRAAAHAARVGRRDARAAQTRRRVAQRLLGLARSPARAAALALARARPLDLAVHGFGAASLSLHRHTPLHTLRHPPALRRKRRLPTTHDAKIGTFARSVRAFGHANGANGVPLRAFGH